MKAAMLLALLAFLLGTVAWREWSVDETLRLLVHTGLLSTASLCNQ